MTLGELTEAWNELRNSALGRGVKPNVSPSLARRVGREHAAFRNWVRDATPVDDIITSASSRKWVQRYRKLLAQVQREGVEPSFSLPMTAMEAASHLGDTLERSIAWGVFGTGVGIALFILAKMGGGSKK